MLRIARERAEARGVAQRCSFELGDFLIYPIHERFDYAIAMGFMDYVSDPRPVIDRVLDIVRTRAFFSFPKAGGPLAWQRQGVIATAATCSCIGDQIHSLISPTGAAFTIDSIGRDFFVTLEPVRRAA